MLHIRRTQLIVALCTGCALIAFAAYQRHHAVPISSAAFYVAAAIICVIGELYGRLRRKTCRSKSSVR
jgi:uncharacterized membrane protein YjjB (DUF3815 family)